ncbi:unnamed protein product [Arctia plantaginis]|uniref:WWE domain-containing protein n=1 Tax=Arctia plantaginis TaxID=874455 RepID=A0A8S1BF43_ARCPL|nr:unnamed protein product [Arctia plantaginis]
MKHLILVRHDDTVTYSHTLGNTDHDLTCFPSGDSNSNILSTHPPISTHSYNLDSQTGHYYDKKQDLLNTAVSKASTKTEDDFDVNEYFARLQGTRYVSAPLHSHPDPNANLTETEENLEEINLNDDKTSEVQQSLTSDIAQNFSQLPNVLPHVASAVFSSFSNMWSMKSREQTPDERAHSLQDVQFQENQAPIQFQSIQGSQKYEDVQFQGTPDSNQFQSQGFTSNISSVPVMKTEDAVKEVAPPPKEPPTSGASNFRLSTTRKKYAQIPGLSTGESQQIAFNPLTQNVPSYFIPTDFNTSEENEKTDTVECSNNITEPISKDKNESYNIFTPVHDTTTEEISNPIHAFMPDNNFHKPLEETLPPINLQNVIPDIPPPPMFSTQRKENPAGKSILPPSVARRIGSNHPVMKQQIIPPSLTDNIFVPTFDSTPTNEPNISSDGTAIPTHNTQMFTSNINSPFQPLRQEIPSAWPTNLPAQISHPSSTIPQSAPPMNKSSSSTITFPSQPDPNSKEVLPENKPAPYIFESIKQTVTPSIFTPGFSDSASPPSSSGLLSSPPESTRLPPPTNVFSPHPSVPQAITASFSAATTVGSYTEQNLSLFTMQTPNQTNLSSLESNAAETQLLSHPPKSLVEPPKVIGASNFRMIKKRPQYYSGPIEGFGSISNNIKPIIPAVDSGTFQGALFTPEQAQHDTSIPSFDINKPTESSASYTHSEVSPVANLGSNLTMPPFMNQESTYANYNTTPFQDDNNPYDVSRSKAQSYESKEEIKESKGFGIIGSLKSKLSNIDINKIQSSVTTFFDPGYTNTKKDDFVAQENIPYNPPQYHAQPQSNIDIFVPNIEPSMPYSSNSQGYQNIYGQGNYDNSGQYNIHQQNPPFMDQNYPNQTYSRNYYSEQIQNQHHVSNICSQGNTADIITSNLQSTSNTNIPSKIETKDSSKNINYTQTEVYPTNETDNFSEISSLLHTEVKNEENTSNLETKPEPAMKSKSYEFECSITEIIDSTSKLSNIIPCPGEYKDTIVNNSLYEPPQTIAEQKSLFETSSNFYPNQFEENRDNMPKQTFAIETKSTTQSVMSSNTAHNIRDKVENTKKDNLLESLSKEDVPILGVSSVPLFGLATIVGDKANKSNEQSYGIGLPLYERIRNKDIIDRNASISFFDHVGVKDQKTLGQGAFNIDNTLKSKDEEYHAQITSASYFTNDDIPEENVNITKSDVMVDREVNLFENIGAKAKPGDFDINEETVLVKKENVDHFKDIYKPEDIENVSELNICETCREVYKPEEKDIDKDDLTTQLIENITSPIQLSNPVEVPLTEDNNGEQVEFDAEQFEEISHITEETMESINVQSVTELLDDDGIKSMNYEWTAGEDYTSNPLKPHDYAFQGNRNAVGFFGDSPLNNKVPKNASDELKAEFRHQVVILPRQMSIPSAPPAEEDSKFDESGVLDVNSIELDAKEDFPVYEEFVIEPSETDDDKLEFKEREKTEENELDSFTNRVEKFKKMEEVADNVESKPVLKLHELHNQPVSMASYFDTGNYAAETHYRNILISPSNITIPPGFEEEFKKRLALANEKNLLKTVPDTQTQTKSTVSVTTAQSIMPVGFNVVSNFTKAVITDTLTETPLFMAESVKMTESSSIFDSQEKEPASFINYGSFDMMKQPSEIASEAIKTDIIPGSSIFPTISGDDKIGVVQMPEASSVCKPDAVEMPKVSSIFGSQGLILETSNIFASSKPKIPEPSLLFPPSNLGIDANETNTEKRMAAPVLPDPMNFFADSTPEAPSENINRLASYFSSPPKTEHAKSFFELSQSQNHYKYSTSSQKYEDLIKDLTSVQNLAVPTDQTIRHVNYFTVEYDVVPEFSKGDNSADVLIDTDEKDLESLNHCSYCTALIYDKRYKVKSSMNNNTEEPNSEPNMETTNSGPTNSVTVNFDGIPLNEETNEGVVIQAEHRSSPEYGPVKHHWFYRVDVEDKSIWRGFSVQDSRALESSYLSPDLNESTLVPTDGGRYDVNLMGRLRIPVYWSDKPTNVRRCSWFYKGTTDPRYVPYTETVAEKLEDEYWHGISTGEWHRRLVLPNGEVVVMHGPNVMVHFLHSDAFSTPPQSSSRPRVVRRGHDDSEIEDAEPSSIDHLLLLCHGVGSACDMRFRSVEEVVEDFRATSLQLVQSHYKNSYDQGIVNRVEVLPISWHEALHSGETGVDRRLAQITLDSIPRLRNFTNDTVLDVLFYTSPVFCQTILNTVCQELNRIYQLFKKRNPSFEGGVSLGGHSLGSVILYDLLCHQLAESERRESQVSEKQYVPGPAGTGRPGVLYPRLEFEPAALYALGSPIAIFECIRGVESLGAEFALPTCKNFFNIFHPYDPIAYRIEPLINSRLKELKPYLIPHHKGRKRMHLELKDTMARVGADLKQKLVESLRNTWNKWKSTPTDGSLEQVVEEDLEREQLFENKEELAKERELSTPEMLGRLNGGRRVDYVLQEAPLEMINEYLFAMSSHVGYWELKPDDFAAREIYSALESSRTPRSHSRA